MSLSIESYSTPPPPPLSRFHHRVKRTLSRNTLSLLSAALLLIVIAPQTFAAVGTWTTQVSGTSSNLFDVSFVDANNGWAVGNGGKIVHTSNGGTTWATQTSTISVDLYGVSFVDANNGWAVGNGGEIVHTSDGGTTWATQDSTISDGLFGVSFFGENNGWAVGDGGKIVHTSDGGTTWATQDSTISDTLNSVSFVDAMNGWAVGDSGEIVHTTDGGTTWATQDSTISDGLFGVSFVDENGENNGWAVGDGGKIVHTSDGGTNWATQTSTVSADLRAVSFVDANNGLAVGRSGTIVHTSNGGGTWAEQTSGTNQKLQGVLFFDANNGWAVGNGGVILRFDSPVINTEAEALNVDAGTDQAVPLSTITTTVTLMGSADSRLATTIIYSWTQVSGSPTVTLSDETIAMPSFTFVPTEDAFLVFELTVSASRGGTTATATDRVTITVGTPKQGLSETAIKQLNQSIAPRFVQSMLASSASAIGGRIDASFSGAGQLQVAQVASYQLDGQTRLSSLKSTLMKKLPVYASSIKNNTIDWKQMLGNSSFVLPLNVDGGDGSGAAGTNLTIWGRGDYTNLSGKNWKGNVVSAQLGADTRVRDDLLVGGLLSSSKGDVDYTASGSGDTEYKHSITSIHPYIAWSSNDINLWGSAGYGQGKLEIEDTADKNNGVKNNSDTKLFSLSGGAKGQVAEGINLKSDLNLMQLRIDESENITAEKISSQRLRLLLEIERERQLETGVLKPTLEFGARYDGGDGNTGTGAVLNGSLNYTNAITGWTVGGKLHTLIGRKNYKEWGVSGVVSKHVAVNGRGVSFNLIPSYGDTGGSAAQAWQQPAEVRNSGNKHNNMRINTRLGYGFAPSGNGLLTPYSEATFGESNRYLVGINWQRHSRFGMTVSSEHEAGNTKNHVLGINWTRPRYTTTLSAGRNEANDSTTKHSILLESRIGF